MLSQITIFHKLQFLSAGIKFSLTFKPTILCSQYENIYSVAALCAWEWQYYMASIQIMDWVEMTNGCCLAAAQSKTGRH